VSALRGLSLSIASGIVLGIIALNQIKQTREGGQGLAIAGIALGGAAVFVWLIIMVASAVN